MDPITFLLSRPPFDRLPPGLAAHLEAGLEIEYQPRDARILSRDGSPNRFLYVVRKGAVRLVRDGSPVQVIEEGECFGFPSLIARAAPNADVMAVEDTLLYRVPQTVFDELMEHRDFAEFFLAGLADRLRRTASAQSLPIGPGMATPVSRLVVSPPIHVAPSLSVGEAARVMRDRHISSVLVDTEPVGILTDRDLRSRVVAEERDPASTRVADVSSRPLLTLGENATLFEALTFMLERRVHHVPIASLSSVVGIVTDTDLLRLSVKNPLHLVQQIERVEGPRDLPHYAGELAAMVETLAWSGLGGDRIGPVVARLNDTLVARLLRLAEGDVGPPPVPYAWIVFGSEGRMEQTLLTDQDNALVHGGDEQAHAAYFAALAAHVVRNLEAASFPPCAGGFMATNWHHSLREWTLLFHGWIDTPDPPALVEALNFFDFRAVHGTLNLDSLDALIAKAGKEPLFLAQLARASLGLRPPVGLFRQLRSEPDGIDLKKGGLAPIASLARLYALEAGSPVRATIDRLSAAAKAGVLSHETADLLTEGFRFLIGLRLREQLQALRDRRVPTNVVPLDRLAPMERQHLKDVFLAIREAQHATAIRHAIHQLA